MIDVVCGILMDRQGRYLACRRPRGKHLGGLWEFPGGKVDPGEAPERALVRELYEELGNEVPVGSALAAVAWKYDLGEIRLLPYFCTMRDDQTPRAIEHEALIWCAPENFGTLSWAAADLPVLDQILAMGFSIESAAPPNGLASGGATA